MLIHNQRAVRLASYSLKPTDTALSSDISRVEQEYNGGVFFCLRVQGAKGLYWILALYPPELQIWDDEATSTTL